MAVAFGSRFGVVQMRVGYVIHVSTLDPVAHAHHAGATGVPIAIYLGSVSVMTKPVAATVPVLVIT